MTTPSLGLRGLMSFIKTGTHFSMQMSIKKDFTIPSPVLYNQLPGGAISDHKPFLSGNEVIIIVINLTGFKKGDLCSVAAC